MPLAARALLPPTIKKIVIFGFLWFFYGFSVFLSNITFALEDRFLWFVGVCISTFSHKNGYRKFQLLKLSSKNFGANNCGPYSIQLDIQLDFRNPS